MELLHSQMWRHEAQVAETWALLFLGWMKFLLQSLHIFETSSLCSLAWHSAGPDTQDRSFSYQWSSAEERKKPTTSNVPGAEWLMLNWSLPFSSLTPWAVCGASVSFSLRITNHSHWGYQVSSQLLSDVDNSQWVTWTLSISPFLFFIFFDRVLCSLADLELTKETRLTLNSWAVCLPQLSECWDYRHVLDSQWDSKILNTELTEC